MREIANIWDAFKLSVLLSILISNCYFYYRLHSELERLHATRDTFSESLLEIGQKRLEIQESLTKLDRDYEALTYKKDSVDRLDSTQRAALRASYRARLRAAAGSGLRANAP